MQTEQQRTYRCSKCKEYKTIENFYQKLYARQSYCIKCNTEYKTKKRNPDDWMYLFCGEEGWMSAYFT